MNLARPSSSPNSRGMPGARRGGTASALLSAQSWKAYVGEEVPVAR